jgi:hypothetical protein
VEGVVQCTDGNVCPSNHTCVNRRVPSEHQHIGQQFGCAPGLSSVVCSDSRFSCPANFSCNLTTLRCIGEAGKQQLLQDTIASFQNDLRVSDESICQVIKSALPSDCTCTDKPLGADAVCSIDMLGLDHIGIVMDVEPCSNPAHIDLEFTEKVCTS